MSSSDERRDHRREADEAVSPEYLAVLVLCGGEVREGDRGVLPPAGAAGPGLSEPEPEPHGDADRSQPQR